MVRRTSDRRGGGHQSLSLKATKNTGQLYQNIHFRTLETNQWHTANRFIHKKQTNKQTTDFGEQQWESAAYLPRADPINLPHPLRSVSTVVLTGGANSITNSFTARKG